MSPLHYRKLFHVQVDQGLSDLDPLLQDCALLMYSSKFAFSFAVDDNVSRAPSVATLDHVYWVNQVRLYQRASLKNHRPSLEKIGGSRIGAHERD